MIEADQDGSAPRRLGILLIDGFALMSYASIIEPFRAANVLAGAELYAWTHVSVDGEAARASNGASILADAAIGAPIEFDTLFVILGGDPTLFSNDAAFGWLRRLAKHGVRLAGVSGGPYVLARAGLLDGYRCTVHWEHVPVMFERFPNILFEDKLYMIDRGRMTCAGGTAGLDMVIGIIERDHGHDLAVKVSDWFIRTQPRHANDSQRVTIRERYNISNRRVLKVLGHMESNLEEPARTAALARIAGVSTRQLERLFRIHLGVTVGDSYRNIRLEHANTLLRKTVMSITEVAISSGFTSSSHFSRCYKARYGRSPRQGRK